MLEPDQYQIVKDLLEKDGKQIGYLTGLSVYNGLGLKTQVGNVIQIGKNDVRNSFSRGKYTISFVRQKNRITKSHIPLLQILDETSESILTDEIIKVQNPITTYSIPGASAELKYADKWNIR